MKKIKVWYRPTIENMVEIIKMRIDGEITHITAKMLIKKFSIPHIVLK